MTTISIDYNNDTIWTMDGIRPMSGAEMGHVLITAIPNRTVFRVSDSGYFAEVSVADWDDFCSLLNALGNSDFLGLEAWLKSDFVAGHLDAEFETGELFEPACVGFIHALFRGFSQEIAEAWETLLRQHEEA